MRKLSNVLVYVAVAIALFGVAIHIGAIFGGASWFAFFRAPRAVVESARAGTWPAPVGAVVIAILMGLCAAYAASSVQLIRRLPALRSVLAAAALLWLSRGLLVLPLAARRPERVDTFQIVAALMWFVAGLGFAAGFRMVKPRPNNLSQPTPLRDAANSGDGQRKMDEALAARFEGFEGAEGASPESVAKIEDAFGRKLPEPLRDILLAADGFGGVIGDHELQVWSVDEIIAYNRANKVQEDCPAFLMFGSDGGGETYTLDYRTNPPSVVLVAAIGFDYESAIPIGRDFISFLERLKDSRSLFER